LCVLAATVFMSLLGKTGMRRLAQVNTARAHEARDRLISGAKLKAAFSGPFFNEFVMRTQDVDAVLHRCAAKKIIPGADLGRWYPELKNCLLICATEMNERQEIEQLVRALAA
jgi:glycine dehydrogenase subunit 1